ncbi:MAG TPA: hypothetical protein K8W01_10670 [Methylorubrum populi]|uniref:Uncharacterized protein n=1 Tax=Methylorubrum populi TaxID=223967 RepID=A0A921JEV2_9HYPH|nr:hypothetical protein [Methylorubrum populi]
MPGYRLPKRGTGHDFGAFGRRERRPQRFEGAAARIALPQRDANPVAAVTDMVSARLGVEINTAVLTSSIEAERRVLDILV